MGSNSHFKVHIGCFIVAPEVEQTIIINEYICPTPKCIHHVKMNHLHKICPECGEKGTLRQDEETEIKLLRIDEFCFEHSLNNNFDTVENDDGDVWIFNHNTSKKLGQFCEDVSINLSQDDVQEKIEKCTREIQPLLEKIKESFGLDMQIQFGAVPYYN